MERFLLRLSQAVPSGLLFMAGLYSSREFHGFLHIFKDAEADVITMSEYLRLVGPLLSKGHPLRLRRFLHFKLPPIFKPINPSMTKLIGKKRVEVEDPKVIATKERKSRASAKRREKRKGGEDEKEGSSFPIYKRKKTSATCRDGSANVSYPEPFQAANLQVQFVIVLPGDHVGESSRSQAIYVPERNVHRRSRVDNPDACRELMVHLTPLAAREETNSLTTDVAIDRAWFTLSLGAMDQAYILEIFESLSDSHVLLKKTHAACDHNVKILVDARHDLDQVSKIYAAMFERYKGAREVHSGCVGQLKALEQERTELARLKTDQARRIKDLEDDLARNDYALVYAEQISAEWAIEKRSS